MPGSKERAGQNEGWLCLKKPVLEKRQKALTLFPALYQILNSKSAKTILEIEKISSYGKQYLL